MKKDLEQQIYFEDMEIGDKAVSVGRTDHAVCGGKV